ncbi:9098_t:CDS:2, partial [Funneliformis geosporum]
FNGDEMNMLVVLDPRSRGYGKVLTVSPAIHKPKPLWTGKQIVCRAPLNLKSKNKISAKYSSEEDTVIFMDGEQAYLINHKL